MVMRCGGGGSQWTVNGVCKGRSADCYQFDTQYRGDIENGLLIDRAHFCLQWRESKQWDNHRGGGVMMQTHPGWDS